MRGEPGGTGVPGPHSYGSPALSRVGILLRGSGILVTLLRARLDELHHAKAIKQHGGFFIDIFRAAALLLF